MRKLLLVGGVAAAALLVAAAVPSPSARAGSLTTAGRCEHGTRAQIMICLVNTVRRRAGVAPLQRVSMLDAAERQKVREIMSCADFSHTPCGQPFASAFVRAGYFRDGTTVGENLAWGSGPHGAPSRVVAVWLASPDHRKNMLSPEWREVGVGVGTGGTALGGDTLVWGVAFGRRD